MNNAFQYVQAGHPLETSAAYPYTASVGTCKYKSSNGVASISSYSNVPQKSVNGLKNAIAQGPVSVAVEADQTAF